MTFFLLLLAFTDGTARTAEVLPRRALAQLAVTGDVLALDNMGVESYVYDRSLPAFHRTRKYRPGERQVGQQRPRMLAAVLASGRAVAGLPKKNAVADVERGSSITGVERHRRRQLQGTAMPAGGPDAAEASGAASTASHLRASETSDKNSWRASSSASGSRRQDGGSDITPGALEPVVAGTPAVPGVAAHERRGDASSLSGDATRRGGINLGGDLERLGPWEESSAGAAASAASASPAGRTATTSLDPTRALAEARADSTDPAAQAIAERSSPPLPREAVEARSAAAVAGASALEGSRGAKGKERGQEQEFGSAPVERGYWFREEKVENTRARIDALCGDVYRRRREGKATEAGSGVGEKTGRYDWVVGRKRLVIYQRDENRRLLALDDNVKVFQGLLGPEWDVVPIVHDNEHEPCWLYSQLMDADMLLTPHGFQSMLLLFLPPGATVLEVFPYKYWKEGYAPLAKEWGVRHEHIMSRPVSWEKRLALFFVPLERCMKSIHCRKWSRGADVRLEEHHLRQIAKAAEQASKRKEEFLPPPTSATPKRGRRE
ncbi:unnamed protein product [Scytosiphon promiscuus]